MNTQNSPLVPLNQRPAWKALETHAQTMKATNLRQLFKEDSGRGQRFTAEADGIFLDYSKNRVIDETLKLLLQLAEESGLRGRIDAMFRGDKINITENRAVLHVALRAPKARPSSSMAKTWCRVFMPCWTRWRVRGAGALRRLEGHTGKRIRNVINIGIGGSDLGPVMAYEALKHYSQRDLTFRFVSNVDGTDFAEAVQDLSPDETLFLVASKTFTTQETMTNAHTARECCWPGWAATKRR